MSFLSNVNIGFADSGSIDAFSRLRVSQTANLFDQQFTYGLGELAFEQLISGTGATITHDATNRCALMTMSSTPIGGYTYMQSYEYIPYQPGRSQLAFITFNPIEGVANAIKFAQLGDSDNAIAFELNGTTKQFTVYSNTSKGDETVIQSNWSLDKLDGSGVSQKTLDITKTQILVIDLQALYVGRVRIGFDIDGIVYYAHEFNHANIDIYPYIQSANLPIRVGMRALGTVSTTMMFICSSVASEGGEQDIRGSGVSIEGTATAGNGVLTHILSLRPKTTFKGFTNRVRLEIESIDVIVTGNSPVKWDLVLGQAITGTTTYIDANTTYSAFEYNTLGTISGTPSLVIASGYASASATVKTAVSSKVSSKYAITLDASGAVRSLGTLTGLVTGLGGNSACRLIINWREIR